MDALDDEALVIIHYRDDAFHAQDIGTELLRDVLDPGNELLRMQRPVGGEREAGDLVIMLVSVLLGEKLRLDVEDAIEVEGVAAEHLAEIDVAPLRWDAGWHRG